ncbi:hypothetical protein [Microvirga zambiensis]|uniref:hypothetical protein n=1 Tax=Microvirga zambiensis TaxID=1402137 RepID=UPI00191EAD05|nr:hypothetical protein [Microvirga zambiensis]
MSTPQDDPAQVIRSLAELTRKRIIGQDEAVAVFALITYSHIALGPLQRRPGVFLITGPNAGESHLDIVGGLIQSLRSMGGLYKLAGNPGEDIDQIFSSSPVATEVVSLQQALKDNPHDVFVLQDIDQAHPNLRTRLERIGSHGCVIDDAGKLRSLADAMFILTTELAQEEIGEIARTDPDPARLHVERLKALVDAGFSASLLRHVDFAFGLKRLTTSERNHAYYARLAALVASHGLVLEESGLDARILLHAMDPTAEPTVPALLLPWDNLSHRLAQIKASGAGTVRFILDDDVIRILRVESATPQWVIDAFAANRGLSADGEATDE